MKQRLITILITAMLTGFLPTETENAPKVSWNTLAEVNWVMKDGKYRIEFSKEIEKLDGQTIELTGFIFPLGFGSGNTEEFLLSANPISGCFYCAPGSSESFVMVYPDDEIEFQYESVTVEGTFELVKDDTYGIVYQMKNARLK